MEATLPAELTSLFSSLSMALTIAKGMKSIDDQVKLNDAIYKLQEAILSAQQISISNQNEMAALIQSKRELEEQISRFSAFEAEKSRYELNKLAGGGLVYSIKEETRNGEPVHHLCASCYEQSKKSIIQADEGLHAICPSCKIKIGYRKRGEIASIA